MLVCCFLEKKQQTFLFIQIKTEFYAPSFGICKTLHKVETSEAKNIFNANTILTIIQVFIDIKSIETAN